MEQKPGVGIQVSDSQVLVLLTLPTPQTLPFSRTWLSAVCSTGQKKLETSETLGLNWQRTISLQESDEEAETYSS